MPTATLASPVGTILVESDGRRLTAIRIGEAAPRSAQPDDPVLVRAIDQLTDYFAGRRTGFDLPLAPAATRRGNDLRAAIAGVGYGETATYGALADRRGSSARAMGQACRTNPFPIVIPCHRVVSAPGGSEHYSAGDGPPTKRWLLNHERKD